MGIGLACACSLQIVFGLVSSRRLYTSVCCICCPPSRNSFFCGPAWRVTNNITPHEKQSASGCPTSWACPPSLSPTFSVSLSPMLSCPLAMTALVFLVIFLRNFANVGQYYGIKAPDYCRFEMAAPSRTTNIAETFCFYQR